MTATEAVTRDTAPSERHPIWWYLWRMARHRPLVYVLLGILEILAWGIIPQAAALLARQIFDALSAASESGHTVWTLIALLVAVALARAIAIFGDVVVYFNFQYNLTTLLRTNVFAHILSRPGARAVPTSPGDAVSRFRDDVVEIGVFMAESLLTLGFAVFAIIAAITMVRIDPWITAVSFVPLLAAFAISNWATERVEALRLASRDMTAHVSGFIGEIYGAVQAIQVATAESRVVERFRRLGDARGRAMVKDRVFSTALDSVYRNTASLGTGLVLLLIARAVHRGESPMSVGDLALFIVYLAYVTEFPSAFGGKLAWYRQVGVSVRRLLDLMPGASPSQLVAHSVCATSARAGSSSRGTTDVDDRLAVLEADLEEFPAGLDTLLGAKGVRLSGGQRQRTAAARVFVRQPELLVFDDLSSALDVETEHLLWQRVDTLRERGATCLVVSHRRPALRRADQIIVMREGTIAARGTLDILLETCEELQRIWSGEV